jgi:hypothetical protein
MKALLKFIKILLLIGLAAVLLGAGTFGAVYIYFSRDLPKISASWTITVRPSSPRSMPGTA